MHMRMHNVSIIHSAETIINELKELDHQSKLIEMRTKQLKAQLTDHYFTTTDTLYGSDGLVIATYKAYTTSYFKSCDFKLDHPDIYKMYSENRDQKRLLIK